MKPISIKGLLVWLALLVGCSTNQSNLVMGKESAQGNQRLAQYYCQSGVVQNPKARPSVTRASVVCSEGGSRIECRESGNPAQGMDAEKIKKYRKRRAERVQERMNGKQSEIKECYKEHHKFNPGLNGKVVLKLVVGVGGRVSRACVQETSVNFSPLEVCMVYKALKWSFGRSKLGEELVVEYPYDLNASRY